MLTIETVREQFFIFSQILASRQLEHPRRVLEDMISTATQLTGLPGHVQSALVMNTFKLYCSLCHAWTEETTIQQEGIVSVSDESSTVYKLLDRLLELTNFLMDKFTLFVHSPDLEVQDRAVSLHQLLCLINRRLLKFQSILCSIMPQFTSDIAIPSADHSDALDSIGPENGSITKSISLAPAIITSVTSLVQELNNLFAGEINPVAPKAQCKVPVPDGLNLNEWINPPVHTAYKMIDFSVGRHSELSEFLSVKSKCFGTITQTTGISGGEIFSGLSSNSPKKVLTAEQLGEVSLRMIMVEAISTFLMLDFVFLILFFYGGMHLLRYLCEVSFMNGYFIYL
ncbi:AP-3 complex subunit delta [Fasciolopsis buskii]|uniref:AP-3 complex subunit delta n=1 Tax=Fasciolopsis buskii TaxID=27845 RepID=A0A8E0RQA5_9TREM|nr:AP-3 complex subunit delta [Fasciolopsis buski]